jgi:rhodanese-related sulfurtransferase
MLVQLTLVVSMLSLAACHSGSCCAPSAAAHKSVAELTPHEVSALAKSASITIVDANPKAVFDEGHVPGAKWMATDDVTSVLPKDRSARIVFYCYNEACGASHTAAQTAVAAGWTSVARMPAGISGWKAAGLPIEK